MNFRTTIIVLALFAGALSFYLFVNSGDTPTEETKTETPDKQKGRKLLAVKSADVRKVVIRPGEGAPKDATLIELSQADGRWQLTQPLAWPADPFDTDAFVQKLVDTLSTGEVDISGDKLNAAGLAKPRYHIEVTDAGGKTETLLVGDRSALGHVYVRANNESSGAVVMAGPLRDRLERGTPRIVAELRDKKLLRLAPADVKRLDLAGTPGTPAISLARTGDDWHMTAPLDQPGDAGEIGSLLGTLTALRAEEFEEAAKADSLGAGFDHPRAVITLSKSAPSTQPAQSTTAPATPPADAVVVTIGQSVGIDGKKSWVKVSNPPTVAQVTLSADEVEKLAAATPLALRDRRVFKADAEQVSEISVVEETPDARPYTIARRKEKLELGPFLPKTAGTPPAVEPTTQPAATQPASTQPAATQPAATQPAASANVESRVAWACTHARGERIIRRHGHEYMPMPPASGTHPFDAGSERYSAKTQMPDQNPGLREYAQTPASVGEATLSNLFITLFGVLQAEASPSTQPAVTQPAVTQPTATQPATKPAEPTTPSPAKFTPPEPPVPPAPKSKWVVASAGDSAADDSAVDALLAALAPLRATKYLEKPPAPATQPASATQPAGTQPATKPAQTTYRVTIKTVAAGGEARTFNLKITDAGADAPLVGQYDDLTFELDRDFLNKVRAARGERVEPAEPRMPAMPRGMPQIPGLPPME